MPLRLSSATLRFLSAVLIILSFALPATAQNFGGGDFQGDLSNGFANKASRWGGFGPSLDAGKFANATQPALYKRPPAPAVQQTGYLTSPPPRYDFIANESTPLSELNHPFFNEGAAEPRFHDSGMQSFGTQPYQSNQISESFGRLGPGMKVRPFVDVLFLSRTGLSDGAFVFDDNGVALRYNDLDFGLSTGFRAGVRLMTSWDVGFEYAFMDFSDETIRVVDGPNVEPVFFHGVPAVPVASYDVMYDTDLKSHELNYWGRRSDRGRIGIGFRTISLRENFDIIDSATNGTGGVTGFFSDTDNDLFGGQLLLERTRNLGNGINLVLGGKIGGYHNNVDVRAFALGNEIHREDEALSFVFDFNAGWTFDMTANTQLKFGYQGMVLTEVAVAPDQSERYSFFDSLGATAFGTASFHGMYLGGELAY